MNNETISVTTHCPECSKNDTILNIPLQGYADWIGGELIQRALPNVDYKQREQLISGICPECWDKMFKPEKKED